MLRKLPYGLLALGAVMVTAATATPAAAKCTRLGFSVNDYGKDGPTKDAQQLLDRYIADWAAERGIKKYTVGKKDVKCELFLDLILFDEHTCRAEATVCWPGKDGPDPVNANAGGSRKVAKPAGIETGSVPAAKKQ